MNIGDPVESLVLSNSSDRFVGVVQDIYEDFIEVRYRCDSSTLVHSYEWFHEDNWRVSLTIS